MSYYCWIMSSTLIVEQIFLLLFTGAHEAEKRWRYYQAREDHFYLWANLGNPYIRYIQLIVGFTICSMTPFTCGKKQKEDSDSEDSSTYVKMSVIE